MQTSMSVHQIRVSMGAHAWTASTAIGACVPQVGAGLTVSWTRTSAAVVPVWMPTPARIFREDTSVTVRLDGQGRTATSVGVLTYILILKPKTTFQKCNEIYITQDCKIAILWCHFSFIFHNTDTNVKGRSNWSNFSKLRHHFDLWESIYANW